MDILSVNSQLGKDNLGGAITHLQKNHLWRKSSYQAHLMKIGILGKDHKSMFPSKIPDFLICDTIQTKAADVD